MIIFRYCLGIILAHFFFSTIAIAGVNTSGMKYSLYLGSQNTSISPGSFTLEGNETEKLLPNHSSNVDATYGLGAAYRYVTPAKTPLAVYLHDLSIGLDIYYFRTSQSGAVLDYSVFDNFEYQLKIQSIRLMANMEWTFPMVCKRFYPFIQGGIGVSSNKTSYYDIPNGNSSSGAGINMPRDIAYQFAYDFGAGVKAMLSNNVEISLRYMYTDLGAATVGDHASLPVSSNLNIPLSARTWLLGFSYIM